MDVHFYEISVLTEANHDAGDISTMADGVCEKASGDLTHIGTTVHNRPPAMDDYRGKSVATVTVTSSRDKHNVIPLVDEFGGIMSRTYGLPVIDAQQFGEVTLSLKGDNESIKDYIEDAMGGDEDDDSFSIDLPDQADSETVFSVEGDDDE